MPRPLGTTRLLGAVDVTDGDLADLSKALTSIVSACSVSDIAEVLVLRQAERLLQEVRLDRSLVALADAREWDSEAIWRAGDEVIIFTDYIWAPYGAFSFPRIGVISRLDTRTVQIRVKDTGTDVQYARGFPIYPEDGPCKALDFLRPATNATNRIHQAHFLPGVKLVRELSSLLARSGHFIVLEGRCYPHDRLRPLTEAQLHSIERALSQDVLVSTDALRSLVEPPLPSGDLGLFSLHRAMLERPARFANRGLIDSPRWEAAPTHLPPTHRTSPGGYAGGGASKGPEYPEAISPAGQPRRPTVASSERLDAKLPAYAPTGLFGDSRLCQSLSNIAETIGDYRSSEIARPSAEHVARWAAQFDECERPVVLAEISRILDRFYWPRDRVKNSLRVFLQTLDQTEQGLTMNPSQTRFLELPQRGQSQQEMLTIVDEILREDFRLSRRDFRGSRYFIYIDDCVFTGSQLRHGLSSWISGHAPIGSTVMVYHLGAHLDGWLYAKEQMGHLACQKDVDVHWRNAIEIDNRTIATSRMEVLWPRHSDLGGDVALYERQVIERCREQGWNPILYRPDGTPSEETLFSSAVARDTVERAFLKVGSQLVMAARSPAPSVRPLGFAKLESLGLGSLFITFRNIANNCPLALWYGDPSQPQSSPLSRWYPLFPRRMAPETFISTSEFVTDSGHDIFDMEMIPF